MDKGYKLRLEIHNILHKIFVDNYNMDSGIIKKRINNNNKKDIAFINTVCLNSMRYYFHCIKIINLYAKKKCKLHENILLSSAITQLVFLGFKDYAVIDCSVKVAKKLNIYHGFINAILKKIRNDKVNLKKTKLEFYDLPEWFVQKTKYFTKTEKKLFLETVLEEPSQHIVFKNNHKLKSFQYSLELTSDVSGFLKEKINVTKISSYSEGYWWVQDFSSSFPLINIKNDLLKGKCIDLCSAPGGKAFQILSKNKKIQLNDISSKRIKVLQDNLQRLNLNAYITNNDFLKFKTNNKYDFIVLDAPCSAIGTIRRNPEIFFKSKGPNFKKLISLQKSMLSKACQLLETNGVILFMVCSFLKNETLDNVSEFLDNNQNFAINKFYLNNTKYNYRNLIKDNVMLTLPSKINNFNIDGYFAVYLKKMR